MWTGALDVRHVIVLTEQLVLNPRSRVFALRGGTPELQGWDAATVIAARTHNALIGLIGGFSKDFDVKAHLIKYPGPPEPEPEQPLTIADFIRSHVDGGGFNKFMFGEG